MISTQELKSRLTGNWVAIDKHGQPVIYEVPADIGPATLAVAPVTDALKRVDEADRVVESVDKNTVWSVVAIVLNAIVLNRLPEDSFTAEELIEAVRDAGFAWQISPTSAP